jgi:acetyl-CoA carboxylase biotin carboxyl carrier protein
MIDIRKLKELVRLMVANELTELDLRDSEEQVTLRRGGSSSGPPVVTAVAPPPAPAHAAPASAAAPAAAAVVEEEDAFHRIESPMVGTFYAAASPDASAFVSPGSTVGPDTVVCIVEAMKIFNEIKAECSGTIEKVLVRNGESIEFGQPLFLVRP